jgi:hypothetical protein
VISVVTVTVVVIAFVSVFFFVSVGVAMSVLVVLVVPMALVKLPALGIPVIVGVGPVGARVGWTIIVTGDPAIVISLGSPVSFKPDELGCGRWRWWWFVAERWGCNSDVDGDL